jgi:hypothetical protein
MLPADIFSSLHHQLFAQNRTDIFNFFNSTQLKIGVASFSKGIFQTS